MNADDSCRYVVNSLPLATDSQLLSIHPGGQTMLAPVHRPIAFGYARVSDISQIKQDDSVPFQSQRIEAYYKYRLAPECVDWGSVHYDKVAVSAFTRPFHRRKIGAKLMEMMQPGDHLIVDKIDRLSRKTRDLYSVMDWLDKHNIALHVCSFQGGNMDFSTPVGRLLFNFLASLAEFESAQLSERKHVNDTMLRKMGRGISKYPAPGTSYIWQKGSDGKSRKYAIWSKTDRAIMGEIVRLRDEEHLSWEKISDSVEIHLAQQNGRAFKKSAFYKKRWPIKRVQRNYSAECYYRDHNIRDVTEIPASLTVLAEKHAREMNYF
jgi:DNA invertase Pin-like site-specific DNA recombinase